MTRQARLDASVLSTTKTIEGDLVQYTTSTTYDYSGKPVVTTYPDGY